MESQGMDVVTEHLPRRRQLINNLTGIFLKSVHFLNSKCSKCVIVGIFKQRGNSLGVYFQSNGKGVYWPYEVFNQFAVHFDDIEEALADREKRHFKLDSGEDIRVYMGFGKMYAAMYDGEHSLALTSDEFEQFISILPLVERSLKELFLSEVAIQDYIHEYSSKRATEISTTLQPTVADRLTDELGRWGWL